ncbi:MAG: hypothetical protein RLY16_1305 [Bacteroidota bacterium]
MSHIAERKEKNCLNCNAQVVGRYCHVCGQENIVPRESFLHLVRHFFEDITHFDGKFFSTLKLLISKPGFLPTEYNRGRRASYLNPIRMYIFASAVFFLFFFSFVAPHLDEETKPKVYTYSEAKSKFEKKIKSLEKNKTFAFSDSSELAAIEQEIISVKKKLSAINADTGIANTVYHDFSKENNNFTVLGDSRYSTLAQYDSVQQKLPPAKRDGFIARAFKKRSLEINEKYENQKDVFIKKLIDKYLHKFPQILFLSLPLMAWVLHILYLRGRKFYFVNHLIFTVYLFIVTFILFLFQLIFSELGDYFHLRILEWISVLIAIYVFYYQYKAMRKYYGQNRSKTIAKFFIVNFASVFLSIILFLIFLLFSFFQL